ncbi:MAG TPA: hypothetical protein VI455_09080 [Terriglobia bacterium]
MARQFSAWIALVVFAAALVPGGFAPWADRQANSCCRGGRCGMAAGYEPMSGQCHGDDMAPSRGSFACPCSVSQGSTAVVPATAFRFTLHIATITPFFQQNAGFDGPVFTSTVPLRGYGSPLDQPPKA